MDTNRTLTATPRPRRCGLSVVEVLVALLLVTIGLMGIAGNTAVALRTTMEAARRHDATQRALIRLAQLSAAGCTQVMSGALTDTAQQVSEEWDVLAGPNGFTTFTERVDWLSARGPATMSLRGAIAC